MAKKIFIVEDELDFLSTLRERLEFEGFVVATAVDGEEALKKIPEEKPDLILLDIMLPEMNGYQVCRELKSNPETKTIPVVVVTAKSQESDKFWAKETGADDYLTKPFEMEELLQKIQDNLQEDKKTA
jgi:DNA-binding response OmpR family regulator